MLTRGRSVYRTIRMFAVGVFAVWYLPAAKAAIVGDPGPRIAAALAGVVVAFPVTVLASLGALVPFLVTRASSQLAPWQSLLAGIICGVVTQVVTSSPEAPSQ